MEGYSASGMMAVCTVSGSVVLVAFQAHKRLLSDFMDKFETELYGCEKESMKKKVRFAKDVMEPSTNNKEYRKKQVVAKRRREERDQVMNNNTMYYDHDHDYYDCDEDPMVYDQRSMMGMPENRLVLYKGLLDYKVSIKGRNHVL